jgi:hypothetical protein
MAAEDEAEMEQHQEPGEPEVGSCYGHGFDHRGGYSGFTVGL